MGIVILLFFIGTSARAESWVEPVESTSESWATSQSSELLERYFENTTEPVEIDTETPQSLRAPDAFTRYNIGREEPFRPPTSGSAFPSEVELNLYDENLKPYDMMKEFQR